MGIANSGMAVGGVIMPPLATGLLERDGFQRTCWILASAALAVAPILGWLVLDRPKAEVLNDSHEEGAESDDSQVVECTGENWTFNRLFRSSRFWTIALITGVFNGMANALFANLMSLAEHAGVSRQSASYLVSSISLAGVIGMLLLGKLFDVLNQRTIIRVLSVWLIVTYAAFMGKPSYGPLLIAVGMAGLAGGAIILLPAVMAAATYGRTGFAMAYGAISAILVIFITGIIPLFAHSYDDFGSYDYGLLAFIVGLVILFFAASLLPGRTQNPNGRA
jgi:cyanate permease